MLLVSAGSRLAALPLSTVGETMRPLPVEALPGMPPFVAGVSVVRGQPVPVVELAVLLGDARSGDVGRFVTVRSDAGPFVLAVAEVLDIRELPAEALAELPPLLGAEAASVVSAAAAHDRRLIVLLRTARLVPADVTQALRARGAAS